MLNVEKRQILTDIYQKRLKNAKIMLDTADNTIILIAMAGPKSGPNNHKQERMK